MRKAFEIDAFIPTGGKSSFRARISQRTFGHTKTIEKVAFPDSINDFCGRILFHKHLIANFLSLVKANKIGFSELFFFLGLRWQFFCHNVILYTPGMEAQTMTIEIEDLQRLQTQVKSLIAMRKRQEKLSGKSYADMTERQMQKNSADLTWLGMDIDKAIHEAHAAAVDCGIADPRSIERYGPIDYRPSAFHHYRHTPTKPKCRQEVAQ